MARIRTIKPEAFVSESLAAVSVTAERTFFGLLTQVDDEGRIRDNAAILHGAIWPLRPEHTATDVEEDLRQLEKQDLVCRYTAPDGKRYLHLPTFKAHQKISHPTPSRIACCPRHEGPADDPRPGSGKSPEDSRASPESERAADAPAAQDAGDQRQSSPSTDTSEISGNPPESSGISQPHARAGARAPEVEVEVELGTGEKLAAPGALFDTPAESGKSAAADKPRGKRKAKAADPEKDARNSLAVRLTRTWWDGCQPKPSGQFVGRQQIVYGLLEAEHKPDDIAEALRRCGFSMTRNSAEMHLKRIAEERVRAESNVLPFQRRDNDLGGDEHMARFLARQAARRAAQ
jgi:hypothetical protein